MAANKEYLKLIGKIFSTGVMSFSGVVSETAMNVTFPTLMSQFSISTATVQWVTTGYLLILSLVITLSSYLKRNFTSRGLFIMAMSSFIIGTTICMCAPSFSFLIGGRMLQGVGTGIALPLMFNIILSEAPREKLGIFMGIGTLITAMAPAVGPVLGGFFVDRWGWRYIFLVLLCLLLPSLILGLWLIRKGKVEKRTHFHVADYLTIIVGYSAFILATVSAAKAGWLGVTVMGLLALSAVSMLLFAWLSKRQTSPLLRFEVLSYRDFVLCLFSILVIQFAVLAIGYVIPNYSQIVNGTRAFLAGSLMVPGCVIGAALAIVGGTIYDKFGAMRPILAGNLLMLLSLVLFSIYGQHLTTMMFYGFYVILTFGQGLSIGNTMTYALSRLPNDLSADGNALVNSLQQLSGAAGTAVAATIVAASQQTAVPLAHTVSATAGSALSYASATAVGGQHVFILLAVGLFLSLLAAIKTFRIKSDK